MWNKKLLKSHEHKCAYKYIHKIKYCKFQLFTYNFSIFNCFKQLQLWCSPTHVVTWVVGGMFCMKQSCVQLVNIEWPQFSVRYHSLCHKGVCHVIESWETCREQREERQSSDILCTYFCNQRQPTKSMGSIYSINNTVFDKYMTHSYSISAYSKNTVQWTQNIW